MPTTDKRACAQCPYHPNLANANIAQQLMLHIEQMATERRQMLLQIDGILAARQRPPTSSAASTTKPKRTKKR